DRRAELVAEPGGVALACPQQVRHARTLLQPLDPLLHEPQASDAPRTGRPTPRYGGAPFCPDQEPVTASTVTVSSSCTGTRISPARTKLRGDTATPADRHRPIQSRVARLAHGVISGPT